MKTMKTKRAPTNVEKVTVAMEFGSPMNQIVILTAIDKYCERVLREEGEPDNWGNLIDWGAWQAACRDVQQKIK